MLKAKDYCSYWPDKWDSYDLSGCCKMHDEDYENQIGYRLANRKLRECVKGVAGPAMAWTMWLGVSTPIGYYRYLKAGKKGK